MRQRKFATVLALVAFGFSAESFAQNLLGNPAFDVGQGTTGWIIEWGAGQLVADAAHCTMSQALAGTSAISGGGEQFFYFNSTECIALDPDTHPTIFLGGDYRTTGNVFSRIYLTTYNDADCLGSASFTTSVFGPTSASWVRILDAVTVQAGVQAARLSVDNIVAQAGEPQFTVEWDRLYMGYEGEIFPDDFEFEGGSLCRWSTAVGAN